MVWDEDPHGGFTTGKPWLPIPAAHPPLSVAAQDDRPDSLLNHYRRAIALRRDNPVLRDGDMTLHADGPVLDITRQNGDARLTLRANLSDTPHAGLAPWQVQMAKG